MDDPTQITDDNLKTNDEKSPSGNLRPSSPDKWESDEDEPTITAQLSPDGVAVELGEVVLPGNENVREYTVTVTTKNGTKVTYTVISFIYNIMLYRIS